ncbi:MAG: hypothetical protein KC486_26680 [Myxococcales bacterium]|nr:hypothetical protein [Myxococcales bacterium]
MPSPRTATPLRVVAAALCALITATCGDDGGSTSAGATTGGATATATSSTGADATSESTTDSATATSTSTGEATTTAGGETTTTGGAAAWRSDLYPEDWTPELEDGEGRFLHDFSYAGYRGGGVELARELPALTIDLVADHGADPSGESDASPALQAAIDAAADAGGAIITIPAGLFRLDAPVSVSASKIVLRGEGADASRLWMTASAGMSNKSHVTFRGALSYGDDAPLVADAAARAFTVEVADASGLAPGDDVVIGWTITAEFIAEHGMSGVWMAFNGDWQPFFWRTVVAVDTAADPDVITLDVPLRYPAKTRDGASLRAVSGYLREVGVENLGVADATAWEQAWEEDQIHAIELDGVVDGWVRGVASFPSPGAPSDGLGVGRHLQSGGLIVRRSKRVTVADSHLALPENRGGGGNGYLFEVRQSSEILFRDLLGEAGRHNFIQNWGFGATGIVWLRIHSKDGIAVPLKGADVGLTGFSEFHHSLATANLIDQSTIDDGWGAVNRGDYSTGAGHSATQSVLWNSDGSGILRSRQFGHGYVIGPAPSLKVETSLDLLDGLGTEPEDWVEGPGDPDKAGALEPASLYEDQLARRLGG